MKQLLIQKISTQSICLLYTDVEKNTFWYDYLKKKTECYNKLLMLKRIYNIMFKHDFMRVHILGFCGFKLYSIEISYKHIEHVNSKIVWCWYNLFWEIVVHDVMLRKN